MARTSNVFARVEPELKEQAEIILDQLGIPMSNAIGMFLKQVVMRRGLPFDVKLPPAAPLMYHSLSKKQFDSHIETGFSDYHEGNIESAADSFADIEREHGL